jgi:hypothetical protein
MTSLIGIRTNFGLDAIVLAADYQLTGFDDDDKPVSRRVERKLHFDDCWAMGYTGICRKELMRFFGVLKGYKNYGSNPEKARAVIEKAVKEKEFLEVAQLNGRLRKNKVDMENLVSFIFAVNKPKLGLWLVDEYGNFQGIDENKDFDYIYLGSGEDEMNKRIEGLIAERKIDGEKISVGVALKIAGEAMHAAERDPGTGLGYDLVVMTEKETKSWGDEIKDEIRKAEDRKVEEIAKSYEENFAKLVKVP